MKIVVKVAVENSGAFPFKDVKNREIGLTVTKAGASAVEFAKSESAGLHVFELDSTAFDTFTLDFKFWHPLAPKVAIIDLSQTYKWNGTTVEVVTEKPHTFTIHPVLVFAADTAGGVATATIKVKTTAFDLTKAVEAIQGLPDFQPGTLAHARTAANSAGCDVRHLGVLDASGTAWNYIVVIPPAAKKHLSADMGVLIHVGPARAIFSIDQKLKGLQDSLWGHYGSVNRYLKPPGQNAAGTPVQYYGPTTDDPGGHYPNCMIAPMVARMNKPMIVILTWAFWPAITRGQINAMLGFLTAQDLISWPQDRAPAIARLGITGFSAGGQTAMDHAAFHQANLQELWLFDPVFKQGSEPEINATNRQATIVNWFNGSKDPTKKLRLISGLFALDRFKQIFASTSGKTGTVTLQPKAIQTSGISYYGKNDFSKADPDWVATAGAYYGDFQNGKDPNIGWPPHQWVVIGGEGAATKKRTDASFRTYFGDCLFDSGF